MSVNTKGIPGCVALLSILVQFSAYLRMRIAFTVSIVASIAA